MSVLTQSGDLATGPMRTAAPAPTRRRGAGARLVARPPADSPWLASDLIRSATFVMIGLVGLATCWYGISGRAAYGDQVGWLVGAVFSLIFSAFGIIGWLLAGIREVHREMAEVMTIIRVETLHQTLEVPGSEFDLPAAAAARARVVTAGYVTNDSMTRVHRADCQFVQGRDVWAIDVADIERRGLTYCGVCC